MSNSSRYSMTASEMNFKDLLQVLGRRKVLLIVHILIGLAIGFAVSYFGAEKWEAETQLEIQGRTPSSPGFAGNDAISQIVNRPTDFDLLTEVEILKSNELYYATLSNMGKKFPVSRNDFMSNFPRVKIEQATTSKVVLITVTANDEETAKEFALRLPMVYKKTVDDRNADRIKAAIDAVSTSVRQTDNQLKDTIKKLAQFQRSKRITDARQEASMRVGQELNAETQYTTALADMSAAEAELASLRAATSTIPKERTETVVETNVAQLESEKTGLQRLKQQRAELLTRFKPDHPRIKAIDSTIANQEQFINTLEKNVTRVIKRPNPEWDSHAEKVRNAEANLAASRSRVTRFENLLNSRRLDVEDLASTTENQFQLENRLTELQRTRDRQQTTLDELKLRNNPNLDSPIRIISGGTILAEQTAPRWLVNLLLGAGIGLFIGIFVAVARELTLDKVNYPAEAVNIAGADVLARIPIRPKSRHPLIDDPQSARAFEAYRLLRAGTVMKLQQVGQGAFLVTSSVKSEGKTVVAGNLGVAMALDGKQTCVVDCNLRDPKLHKLFRLENDEGLTDLLLKQSPLEGVVKDTSITNLKIVSAGTRLANPTEALASSEMLAIVEQLKTLFDVVIFDCPDAYSVADTQELTRYVRNVLFVVELGQTNKTRMEQSITFIRQASGRILGLALNKDPQAKGRIS